MNLCKCGICGLEVTKEWNKFINGHNRRGKTKENDEAVRRSAEKQSGRTKENNEGRRKQAEKVSEKMKGGKNPATRPDVIRKIRNTVIKLWKDPNSVYHTKEYWKNRSEAQNLKPNQCEILILNLLNKLYPNEWKYTGDWSFFINGKNPDFTCINGKKLLVEHFGDYYHQGENPEDRKKIFEEFGYRTLVIWEKELKNMKKVENKIKKFVKEN